MKSAFKDHFSSHSGHYARYRPTYPPALVDYLAELVPHAQTVLDCGCGSGQLSVLLAKVFAHVVAVDASAEQIAKAKTLPNIEYRVRPGENTGMEAGSVDLVTVAQAAHWFDLDAFYAEGRRVLRSDGVLALITYGIVATDEPVGSVLSHFYFDVVGRFWPPERRHVETAYRHLPFPLREQSAPQMAIATQWSLEQLLGYVDTWSALRNAEAELGREPYERFARDLREAWGSPQQRREFRWPLTMRIGRP